MEWLLLALALLLIAGTGIFVAGEFSLLTLDRHTVDEAVERGDRGAPTIRKAMTHLSTQLSAAQVGITITTLLTGYLMEPSLGRLVSPLLVAAGLSESVASTVSLIIAMVVATVLSMVIGELVPKNLAISAPMTAGKVAVPLQYAFAKVFKPIISVLNGTANKVLLSMGIEPTEEASAGRSPEELTALVRHSAELGTLDTQTATLLTKTLNFSERIAADVMTPRTRMVSVKRTSTAAEIVALARQTGFSRFPVIGENRDDIVGVVHVKQAFSVPRENRGQAYAAGLLTECLRVPETVALDPLLMGLRSRGLQLAVVVDEYGGTAGVVTLEDVVEELVGEVADEHDRMRVSVRRNRDGSWMIPGLMRPDEINALIPAGIPENASYETMGGFMMAELGDIPEPGQEAILETGVLRVERMQGRRVERVRFIPDWTSANAALKQREAKIESRTAESRTAESRAAELKTAGPKTAGEKR